MKDKQYLNGQRKGMMYGGMPRRKPMMYGGKATTKKPRKKAYMGGMMSASQPQQNMQQNQMQNNMTSGQMNQMQTQMMQTPKLRMASGGKTSFGMLSVKAGIDNNPKPTQADRIAGATKKKR